MGAPDGIGTIFLAPLLGRFGAMHPDLVIQLVTLLRVSSLSKREADIAISQAGPQEGRLHASRLLDYGLGLFASPDYLAEHRPTETVEDLRGHRFIGYIDDMIYTLELNYLPLVATNLKPSFVSSNLLAQASATPDGHGLCILPIFMAGRRSDLAACRIGGTRLG